MLLIAFFMSRVINEKNVNYNILVFTNYILNNASATLGPMIIQKHPPLNCCNRKVKKFTADVSTVKSMWTSDSQ